MALGLRRLEGVERRSFAEEFGNDPLERWRDVEHDLLEVTPESVRLSPTGRLFASEACCPSSPRLIAHPRPHPAGIAMARSPSHFPPPGDARRPRGRSAPGRAPPRPGSADPVDHAAPSVTRFSTPRPSPVAPHPALTRPAYRSPAPRTRAAKVLQSLRRTHSASSTARPATRARTELHRIPPAPDGARPRARHRVERDALNRHPTQRQSTPTGICPLDPPSYQGEPQDAWDRRSRRLPGNNATDRADRPIKVPPPSDRGPSIAVQGRPSVILPIIALFHHTTTIPPLFTPMTHTRPHNLNTTPYSP
jgi:hypothetical protein